MPITDIADRLRAAGSTNPSGTHPYESLIDDAESAIRTLRAEVTRLTGDIAAHEKLAKDFMAENRRLSTVLKDIKNLSPLATDHFDPFQTGRQMAAMAISLDTASGSPDTPEKDLPRHKSIDHMAGQMTADILGARGVKEQK